MIKYLRTSVVFSVIVMLNFASTTTFAQCTYSGLQENSATLTIGCGNSTQNVGSGAFQRFTVVNGVRYSFSTCGSAYDTQISGFNSAGAYVGLYNDDNATNGNNACGGGLQSGVDWTSTYSGELRIQMNTFSCVNWPGGGSAILSYRVTPPTTSTNGGDKTVCQGVSSSGLGGNTPSVGVGTWTASSGAVIFSPNANTPDATASSNTPGTYTLTWTISNGGCNSASSLTLNVQSSANSPGAIALSASTVCQGTTVTVNNSASATTGAPASAGPTYYHYYSLNNTGYTLYAGPTASATATLPSVVTNTPGTHYIARNSEFGCAGQANNGSTLNIPLTVVATPTVGAGGAVASICQGGTTSALGGSIGGGATGGTWSTTAGGTFNPNPNTLNATWTPPSGYSGTATLVLTTSGMSPCSAISASKNVVVVATPTVSATPTAGAIATAQTICTGGTPATLTSALDGSGSGVTYRWESSTTSASAGFANISGASGLTYSSGALTQTTWFRRITVSTVGGVSCESVPTAAVEMTVVPDPIAPSITKSPNVSTVCAGTQLTVNVSGGSSGTGTCTNEYRVSNNNGISWGAWSSTIPSITSISGNGVAETTIVEARRECDGTGCNSSVSSVSWTVNPVPVAIATPSSQSFCSGGSTSISLTTLPFVAGTTYAWTVTSETGTSGFSNGSGSSIAQQLFNNGAAPAIVTYVITPTASGCPGTPISVQVTVNPVSNVVATPPSDAICNGELTSIGLTSAVTAASFSWTVSGTAGTGGFSAATGNNIAQVLTNSTLSPGTVTYIVTPSAHGCTGGSINVPITVNPTPAVAFNSLGGPYCISQTTPISLVGLGTPVPPPGSGVFSGTGVAGNDFVPSLAAVGTNTLTYTYTDANGCINTAQRAVVVTGLPLVNFSGLSSAGYCVNTTSPVTLTGFPTGGTFTGPGISGNSFTPSTAGVGLHSIVYTYVDGNGCTNSQTQSVNVYALPVVSIFGLSPAYCVSTAPVTLSGFPTGGTFSGAGMSGNQFNPAVASVGGPYTITYQYADANGCANTATGQVSVDAATNADAGVGGDQCGLNFTFNAVPSVGNGTWTSSGPGTVSYSPNAGNPIATATVSAYGAYSFTWTEVNGQCSSSDGISVLFTQPPTATLSYGTPFCTSNAVAQLPTVSGTTGGSYSSTTGLTLNASTGAVTASTSTAGSYTVTYTVAASNGCSSITATAPVVITSAPTASIVYGGTPFCTNSGAQSVTNSSSVLTGTYSSTTGLSINGTTGEIDPGTSTPGTYTVTYVIAADAGCSSVSAVTNVTVTAAPTATLSYGTPFCTSNTVAQLPTVSGTTGGSYSSTTGLTLNASTGAVTASTSTAGSYTVTYTVAASNGCSSITATAPVVITSAPTASIVYGGTPFCTNSGAQSVTNSSSVLTGTYSSTTGLSINGTTGEIDPGTSTPGTYTVTYVIAADAGCSSVSAVTNVTVTAAPTATLSYGTPFCTSNTVAQLPTLSGTTGGSYSSTPGLTLNGSTGAVTASTSTAGSYTVTYTVAASNGCSSITATAPVVITSAPTASIVYGGTPFCTNSGAQSVTNSSSVLTGTYSSTTGLSINGTTGEIDPGTSTPGTYTVTYVIAADAGCSSVSRGDQRHGDGSTHGHTFVRYTVLHEQHGCAASHVERYDRRQLQQHPRSDAQRFDRCGDREHEHGRQLHGDLHGCGLERLFLDHGHCACGDHVCPHGLDRLCRHTFLHELWRSVGDEQQFTSDGHLQQHHRSQHQWHDRRDRPGHEHTRHLYGDVCDRSRCGLFVRVRGDQRHGDGSTHGHTFVRYTVLHEQHGGAASHVERYDRRQLQQHPRSDAQRFDRCGDREHEHGRQLHGDLHGCGLERLFLDHGHCACGDHVCPHGLDRLCRHTFLHELWRPVGDEQQFTSDGHLQQHHRSQHQWHDRRDRPGHEHTRHLYGDVCDRSRCGLFVRVRGDQRHGDGSTHGHTFVRYTVLHEQHGGAASHVERYDRRQLQQHPRSDAQRFDRCGDREHEHGRQLHGDLHGCGLERLFLDHGHCACGDHVCPPRPRSFMQAHLSARTLAPSR
jgi:hypothetical protein